MRIHGKKWYSKLLAHRFIFGTTDIIDGKLRNGTLLENPVDRDLFHFNYREKWKQDPSKALFWKTKPTDCTFAALDIAAIWGFLLCYNPLHVPYATLGATLRQFHYYFDMKGLAPQLSKTALEALACGCIVVQEDGNWIYPYQIDNQAKINRIVTYYEKITCLSSQ
jgi:hypothetical protein